MGFRDQLFSAPADRAVEPVDTPAGRAYVRTLSAGEKDAFDKAAVADGRFRARLVVACCCDEHGTPEFRPEDVHRIDDLPVSLVEPIIDAAIRANRMRPEDAEAIRKN